MTREELRAETPDQRRERLAEDRRKDEIGWQVMLVVVGLVIGLAVGVFGGMAIASLDSFLIVFATVGVIATLVVVAVFALGLYGIATGGRLW